MPYPPLFRRFGPCADIASCYELAIRPRFNDAGAESGPFYSIMEQIVGSVGSLSWQYQYFADAAAIGSIASPQLLNVLSTSTGSGTVFPADEDRFTVGEVVMIIEPPPATANLLHVWTVKDGRRSRHPLIISTA